MGEEAVTSLTDSGNISAETTETQNAGRPDKRLKAPETPKTAQKSIRVWRDDPRKPKNKRRLRAEGRRTRNACENKRKSKQCSRRKSRQAQPGQTCRASQSEQSQNLRQFVKNLTSLGGGLADPLNPGKMDEAPLQKTVGITTESSRREAVKKEEKGIWWNQPRTNRYPPKTA